MALVQNAYYPGRREGNLERIELFFGDHRAAFEAYVADCLDVLALDRAPPAGIDSMRYQHPEEYLSVPDLCTYYLRYDLSRPPFDDRRVRRAFALATDKDRLAEAMLGGHVFPATGGQVPVGMPGHSPGIALPYSPMEARKLLSEAGYPGGVGFPTVELLWGQGREAIVDDLCAQWKDSLQIEIVGRTVDWASLHNRAHRGSAHIIGGGSAAIYPDPAAFLEPERHKHWYPSYMWRHATYDRLAKAAAQSTDQAERVQLYRQIDRIVTDEAWLLPLWYGRRHLLVKPWVVRLPTSPISGCFWKDVVIEPH
jgi:oligopeptide transport system substrate-binding protein